MKLKDYIQYLKILHDRYGDDIEVKVKVRRVYSDYDKREECVKAFRPCYNKEYNCVILHDFYVSHD